MDNHGLVLGMSAIAETKRNAKKAQKHKAVTAKTGAGMSFAVKSDMVKTFEGAAVIARRDKARH